TQLAQIFQPLIVKLAKHKLLLGTDSLRRCSLKQTEPENPFYMFNPISDPALFYGQSGILEQMYSIVKHGQSVSLLGHRRTGKSSILRCMGHPEIQARFRYELSRQVFVYIDLRTYLKKTCSDFFDDVSQKIVSACSDNLTI